MLQKYAKRIYVVKLEENMNITYKWKRYKRESREKRAVNARVLKEAISKENDENKNKSGRKLVMK